MNLRLFLVIMKSRYLLILFTLAITIATAAVLTMLTPNRYVATASVVLNFNDTNPFEQSSIVPAQLASSYIATQLDIIRSQNVAGKVVDDLRMEDDKYYQETFKSLGGGNGTMRQWLISMLLQNLLIEPSPNSRMVNISYQSGSPKKSADIANAYARSYIATTLELSLEPARRNAAWFDEQIKTMRKRLEDAQARLTNYQQEKGIVAIDERLDTETTRLNELSQAYVAAQADTYDVKSRQLGQNHPEYTRAIARERSVLTSLNDQKARILKLKQERDEVSTLAREVENQQQTYDATLKSFSQTTLQSQFSQTNISMLNQAVTPQSPDSPNVVLNMMASVFLGLMLGVVLAVMIELLNRRVRTIEDVSKLLGTKVLATV